MYVMIAFFGMITSCHLINRWEAVQIAKYTKPGVTNERATTFNDEDDVEELIDNYKDLCEECHEAICVMARNLGASNTTFDYDLKILPLLEKLSDAIEGDPSEIEEDKVPFELEPLGYIYYLPETGYHYSIERPTDSKATNIEIAFPQVLKKHLLNALEATRKSGTQPDSI
jgi:hypothetical protein